MRTFLTSLAVLCLTATVALGQEETPRARPAPTVAAEPAPGITNPAPNHHEAIEALRSGSGALAAFLVVLSLGMAGWGFLSFVVSISPDLTDRAGKALHGSRLKCFLIGLGATLFLLSLIHVSHQKLAVLVLPFLLISLVWGLCGVCEDIGRRAWMLTSREPGRFARVCLGWPVFFFASLVPFLGWFLFVVLGLSGIGAFLIALLSGGKAQGKIMPAAPR